MPFYPVPRDRRDIGAATEDSCDHGLDVVVAGWWVCLQLGVHLQVWVWGLSVLSEFEEAKIIMTTFKINNILTSHHHAADHLI